MPRATAVLVAVIAAQALPAWGAAGTVRAAIAASRVDARAPADTATARRPRRAGGRESTDAGVLVIGDGSGYTRRRSVRVQATIADPDGRGREYEVAEVGAFTGDWKRWGADDRIATTIELAGDDGPRQVGLRYRSSTMEQELSATVALDTADPDVRVSVDDGAAVTPDRRLDVDVEMTDASPIEDMAVSLDGGATWRPIAPVDRHLSLTLPPGTRTGPVEVVVRLTDAAGNTGTGRDRIRYRPPPYATMSLRLVYDLTVDASYRTGRVRVDETVHVTNRVRQVVTWVDLYLMPRAFGELRPGMRVTVDGAPAHTRWINNANLRVDLPAPLARGEATRIRLRYALRARSDVHSSLEARLARAHGFMTVGHWFATVGAGHPARYPGDALVSPVADRITLRLTHDASAVVASPGRRGPRTKRSVVFVHAPARDLAFALSPAYHVKVGHVGRVRIEVYARSPRLAAAALATAHAAVARFSAVLGPYPWPRLVIAESPWAEHGTEYSGFLMIGSKNLANRLLVAHEVAHEWFQAMVGNDQFLDPWVDESVAEFLSRLYFDRPAAYCSTRPINTSIFEYPNVQMPTLAARCGSYFQTVYLKGQAMYWGLRRRMGQVRLLRALRAVVAEHAWELVTTADMRRTLLAHGAPERYLDSFLRGW